MRKNDVEADLKKAYETKVVNFSTKRIRQMAFIIDRDVVENTPVKTGHAESNWIPTINAPSKQIIELGQSPQKVMDVTRDMDLTDTIFITNNLPYIKPLNDGSSKQMAAGFVERAIQRGKASL